MKDIKLHTGLVVDVCDDDTNINDFIHSKINTVGREDKDDPFFICDLGDIVKKWKRFLKVLPQVQPFYAIKCNPDPEIVKLLARLGANFDCASKSEIKTVLDQGVSPDRIIFANPCKQASFIKYAAANNVKLMTFDNEMELRKIKQFFPTAELVIRIRVDDSKSLCKFGIKFGACPTQCRKLLETAKTLSLNVVGVSFHVGSGCYDSSLFYDAVKSAKKVFDEGKEVGYQFSLLDVGGGFPGTDEAEISFEEAAGKLKEGFNIFFPPESNVKIIAEPGRYFVASSCTAACNVTSVRKVDADRKAGTEEGYMYYLNDGVYGSFNCILFDHQYPIAYALNHALNHEGGGPVFQSSIWGPTCDSMDCIAKSATLPKVNVGEWVCFSNMGAYTIAAASRFNGFKQPTVMYMCRRKFADYLVKTESETTVVVKKIYPIKETVLLNSACAN